MEATKSPDLEPKPNLQIFVDLGRIKKGKDIIPEAIKGLPQEPDYLDIDQNICLVVGDNGSGKTTLVTAVAYAAKGRTFGSDSDVLEKKPALALFPAIELAGTFEAVMFFDGTASKRGVGQMGAHEDFSNRQARDARFTPYREALSKAAREMPVLIILDEPESGMSPKRQQALSEEFRSLLEAAPPGSMLLVATNSPELALHSTYPRIDLDEPEKGIQNPD